jgi:hypothetical protein
MIKFVLGVIVGIILFVFFLYFGGGTTVKKIGEGLSDTGKKMEALEGVMKKEADETLKGVKKKIFKEERDPSKATQ